MVNNVAIRNLIHLSRATFCLDLLFPEISTVSTRSYSYKGNFPSCRLWFSWNNLYDFFGCLLQCCFYGFSQCALETLQKNSEKSSFEHALTVQTGRAREAKECDLPCPALPARTVYAGSKPDFLEYFESASRAHWKKQKNTVLMDQRTKFQKENKNKQKL